MLISGHTKKGGGEGGHVPEMPPPVYTKTRRDHFLSGGLMEWNSTFVFISQKCFQLVLSFFDTY